jgi:hypothetical protein
MPKKIDSVTTLTKIDVDQSGFRYFETVSAKVDKATFPQNMKRIISPTLCKDKDVRESLSNNLSYSYIYVDPNQNPIAQITITKADCPY